MSWFAEISGVSWSSAIGVSLMSYALGCLTLGYYLVRFSTGQDVRQLGTGSVGAKNVGRWLGRWGFAATLAGDVGKGAVAVWMADRVSASDELKILAMLAVVAGHIWPAQLGFHGGKGMATSAGALLFYDPWLMAWMIAIFVIVFAVVRSTVLAALAAYTVLPLLGGLLGLSLRAAIGLTALSAFVLFAHRSNLKEEWERLVAHRR